MAYSEPLKDSLERSQWALSKWENEGGAIKLQIVRTKRRQVPADKQRTCAPPNSRGRA